MSIVYQGSGAAIALAGADKLYGNRAYAGMFDHLGWSRDEVRAAAAGETVGGLLMIPRATRRLGGALVAAVSAVVLASELRNNDTRLAAYRAAVLIAGLAAVVAPGD